jgi:two-component system chemotaxis response regulator CheB
VREEILRKVELARSVRVGAPTRREPILNHAPVQKVVTGAAPQNVIAIAASTGGPSALLELFGRLPPNYPHAIVVAQHMPESFTRTFAERLDRRSPVAVSEAKEGDSLDAGTAYVCPGRQCLEIESNSRGMRVRLRAPEPEDRYVPSADAMLKSVARVAGNRSVAVVLTGMGDDGARGAKSIIDAGGTVVVESEATAVVYGMPGAVVRSKLASKSLPLPELAAWLAAL